MQTQTRPSPILYLTASLFHANSQEPEGIWVYLLFEFSVATKIVLWEIFK